MHCRPNWSLTPPLLLKQAFAEFVGTFILVLIGNGSIAQSLLSNEEKGDFFSINWGWAMGVTLGVLISANISGGHLNPAITLALSLKRQFPWKRLLVYWAAQYLGALVASGTVFGLYREAIYGGKPHHKFRIKVNPNDPGTAVIFANYPEPYTSTGEALAEEIVATMVLMLAICVVTDPRYSKVPAYLQPFYAGFAMLSIGLAYGANCGYALNPARDLAPRLVSLIGGYGVGVFSFRGYNWFWVFIVGPHIGAVLGYIIFRLLLKSVPSDPAQSTQKPNNPPEVFYMKPTYKSTSFNDNEVQLECVKC